MKAASDQMIELLNTSEQFYMADLYTLSLVDGTVLHLTSADRDVSYGGATYLSSGPRVKRERTSIKLGVQVDSLKVSIYPSSNDTINGTPLLLFILNGGFDGATVSIDRTFMPTWGDTSPGAINMFFGLVSDVECTRTGAVVTVASYLEVLNQKVPRSVYQAGCLNTLFDSGCTLSKSTFAVTSAVVSAASTNTIGCGLTQAAGYFDQGTVMFMSGTNNGARRTVKSHTSGRLVLTMPLPSLPAPGDTFIAFPGCDKTQSTCTTKFNNVAHFRGFPYIPTAESAI